jgi:hypothetical protein
MTKESPVIYEVYVEQKGKGKQKKAGAASAQSVR